MKKYYYYQISGKERHINVTKYIKDKSMADAKLSFLCGTNCDKVISWMKIDKITYDKHFTQHL